MKKILMLMGILSFFECGAKNLTPKETELVNMLDFNIELMKELKNETKNELIQLPAIDQETADVLDEFCNGIHSNTSEEKANSIVKKLKEKFRAKGYLIFAFTGEEDSKNIGVIKGTNDLDILRYRRTGGINHGYENEDIVKKISEWNDKFGLTVIGCGRDWLELKFKKLPNNLDAFANEVYEFCPDSVDQGVGEVENLKLMIKEMSGIWLWWD
ncbi:conserved hypothetical protein [Tenacibaculum maritimum]|nr:conserved hypothetical protein [Tenacibaculum maritimum]